MAEQYDLIVIGSGPAGASGAMAAARLGKRVALVERETHLGGTGLNTGTVPSKTLRETAHVLDAVRRHSIPNIAISNEWNLADILYGRQRVLESEWGLIRNNFERRQITVVRGEAKFVDAHTVRVGERELTSAAILVAPGSSARYPDGLNLAYPNIFDSFTLVNMQQVPKTMLIIGGGVVGTECACLFNALGVDLTVVEVGDRILPAVDKELSERLHQRLERDGVRILLNANATHCVDVDGRLQFTLTTGETLTVEAAIVAVGRKGNTPGLGLEAIGVQPDAFGFVAVDEHYQTSTLGVYAAGDITGRPAYVATSMVQAAVAISHAFNTPLPHQPVIPVAIYTIPEIADVGLSEKECEAQGQAYLVGRATYQANPRGQLIGDTAGYVKVVFSPMDGRLLGAHHIGEGASELIHIPAMALTLGGTIHTLASTAFNYPTLSDVYRSAALDGLERLEFWKRQHED